MAVGTRDLKTTKTIYIQSEIDSDVALTLKHVIFNKCEKNLNQEKILGPS